MKPFEYEITRHSADQFRELVYFCSEQGSCNMQSVPVDQTQVLRDLLNERGRQGWELVQMLIGKDGLMVIWKRETGR